MLSWEKGGIGPIYLCDSHAAEIGKNSVGVRAMTPQSVPGSRPAEQPKRSGASGGPADAQTRSAKEDLAVIEAPLPDFASGDSAEALVNEAGNVAREPLETYRIVLQSEKPFPATEEKRAERADLERMCVSRYGERCACDATVHCPKCGRWFCDAHGEDEKWHTCALPI
jgi:hypothetical protein